MFISTLSLFAVDLLHRFTVRYAEAKCCPPPHCWWSKNWSPCHSCSVTAWSFSHAANAKTLKLLRNSLQKYPKGWYLFIRPFPWKEKRGQKLCKISTQNNPCMARFFATPPLSGQVQLCMLLCFQNVTFAIIPPPPFLSWNNLERHKFHVGTLSDQLGLWSPSSFVQSCNNWLNWVIRA